MEQRRTRSRQRLPNPPPLHIWMILGALVFACFLFVLTLGLLGLGRTAGSPPPAIAILEIMPAVRLQPATATPSGGSSSGSETGVPEPPAGNLAVGAYVQVTGTGGTGLRLRDQPGLNGSVLLVASEAEVFKVDEGPIEMDGYSWWHLAGPFDDSRQGWAVVNYLEIVQNP